MRVFGWVTFCFVYLNVTVVGYSDLFLSFLGFLACIFLEHWLIRSFM